MYPKHFSYALRHMSSCPALFKCSSKSSILPIPQEDSEIPCIALPNNIYCQSKLNTQTFSQFSIENIQVISKSSLNSNKISLPIAYLKLSKHKLTGMVVVSQICGYLMSPGPFGFSTFLAAAIGTGLTAASANTINQYLEIPYDALMKRTKNRVLVRDQISKSHALAFAGLTGTIGILTLAAMVNNISATLGAFNLFLYTCIYTRAKRITILNTWYGALVGAIPPLIGYHARLHESSQYLFHNNLSLFKEYCSDKTDFLHRFSANLLEKLPDLNSQVSYFIYQTFESCHHILAQIFTFIDPVSILMAALLFSWQFPHFNALSWNLKSEYARAGYRMMCNENPVLCLKSSLNHSIYSLAIVCLLLIFLSERYKRLSKDIPNLTEIHTESKQSNQLFLSNTTKLPHLKNRDNFLKISLAIALSLLLPLNLYNIHLARNFKRIGDSNSARKLFRYSLVYLPSNLGVLLAYKSCISTKPN